MSLQESISVPLSANGPVQTGGQSDSESFGPIARAILGKDAGLHLAHITGFPERSCYRYASGERAPPFEFMLALFHSEHGEPFFRAFMEGCAARWWSEHQRKLHNAEQLDALDLR